MLGFVSIIVLFVEAAVEWLFIDLAFGIVGAVWRAFAAAMDAAFAIWFSLLSREFREQRQREHAAATPRRRREMAAETVLGVIVNVTAFLLLLALL